MWRRGISSIIKPGSYIKKLVKCSSQLVSPKTVLEEGISDISSFKVGEVVHGFKVNDVQNVPDFNITAVMLIHDKTKSKYLHLYRNDLNNVFSINFRTTPMDDTGVPHILEHTVLCGSQKYPVRDPFFKMLNRSLATFMNAMTGADLTFYPFSTQNFTDYQNLQKIYCDSVFRPNLNQLDFLQEGWRLENTNPNDKNSELIIKGVVYNEMKGAFAENERLLEQKIQNVLLPDHTYRFISGGDPLKIPDLTWEGLKNFHRTHYHPSNARFFSYGNFPLRPTLKFLNDEYLSHYEFLDPKHTEIPDQKRWEKPQSQEIPCRFENVRGPIEKQNFVSVSLLMSRIIDTYDTFLLQFLTELLIKGPNAPFYKSMIEPNFSGGFTQTTGLDTQPKESMFTVGLQGLTKDTMGKVVELFDSTIDEVIKKGFDEKHIESVLHRYELGIKHETSNFGLHLLFGAAPILNHDGPVIEGLKVNALIDRLKREMQNDKEYLQKAVRKYFKDNKHRLVLTMSADKEYEERQLLLEKGVITEKTKSLSNDDKEKIFVINQELLRTQTTPQNIDLLPTLKMEDISGDIEKVPKEKIQMGPVSTQINKVNSNGITYFKAILNTSDLTPEQQMLLPLFCYVINKLGAGSYDYREFDSLVNRKTAGLDLSVHIGDSLYQLHSYESGIYISSYCLDKNVDAMFDLWTQIFKISNLTDVERFSTLVKLYMTNLTSGLADSGHAYAMQAAAGLVSGSAYQKELLTGLQHIAYMKRLAHTASYKAMLLEISNIAKTLFDKHKMRCCLNLTESNKKSIVSSYEKFITGLPGNVPSIPPGIYTTTKVWTPTDSVNCQHHVLNLPVNYCSKAILTVPYTNPDYARLRIFSRLLSTKYLHPELREKQGAYGGGARLRDDGVFVFYTYRDPRNLQTLDVFDDSYKWMQQELGRVTQQDLLEAKFGVFQTVDAPIPPSGKGCREFVTGLTPEILQRHRAELMAVDINGLRQVGEKYLSGKLASACSKVVLGPKSESFDTKGRQDELWTVVDT